jgi:hypothetical protein
MQYVNRYFYKLASLSLGTLPVDVSYFQELLLKQILSLPKQLLQVQGLM